MAETDRRRVGVWCEPAAAADDIPRGARPDANGTYPGMYWDGTAESAQAIIDWVATEPAWLAWRSADPADRGRIVVSRQPITDIENQRNHEVLKPGCNLIWRAPGGGRSTDDQPGQFRATTGTMEYVGPLDRWADHWISLHGHGRYARWTRQGED